MEYKIEEKLSKMLSTLFQEGDVNRSEFGLIIDYILKLDLDNDVLKFIKEEHEKNIDLNNDQILYRFEIWKKVKFLVKIMKYIHSRCSIAKRHDKRLNEIMDSIDRQNDNFLLGENCTIIYLYDRVKMYLDILKQYARIAPFKKEYTNKNNKI